MTRTFTPFRSFTHPKDAKPGHKWQTVGGEKDIDVRQTNYEGVIAKIDGPTGPMWHLFSKTGLFVQFPPWRLNGLDKYNLIDAPAEPDYRDGNWHRWDGRDECPVNEGDEVAVHRCVKNSTGELVVSSGTDLAKNLSWEDVAAFLVTKKVEPEPDEYWQLNRTNEHGPRHSLFSTLNDAKSDQSVHGGTIYHCKEVK